MRRLSSQVPSMVPSRLGLPVGQTGWCKSLEPQVLAMDVVSATTFLDAAILCLTNCPAGMILAVASMRNPDYVPTDWQTFLLTVFIMITQSVLSSMPTRWIANLNSVGTVVNIACLFITIIIIPAASKVTPKFQSSDFAWSIQNFTDWPDGIAVMMSFLAITWTMSGYGSFPYSIRP